MTDHMADDADLVVIPKQKLRGSRRDMLASIDEAITGLLALRHLIAGEPMAARAGETGPVASGGSRYLPERFAKIGWLFSGRTH